jgi:fatty acid desaturase
LKISVAKAQIFQLSQLMSKPISNHKQLLASLPDTLRQELTCKSDFRGLAKLSSHIVAIGFSTFWIVQGLPGWQGMMVLQGIMLVFLFTLLHETSHSTVFKTQWLNATVGWICSLIVILPPNWFRFFHLAHHRHTHHPEKDPELEGGRPETFSQYLWAVSGIPVWKFHLKTIALNAFGNPIYDYVPPSGLLKIKHEARIMVGLYAVVFLWMMVSGNLALVWLWFLPVLLGQPFLRLYLMAEHDRCPHVSSMLENTRTTFTNRFVRWLAWNMPYHAEHHSYPSVPFYQLPKFHEVAKEHLRVTENGYVQFQREKIATLEATGEQA